VTLDPFVEQEHEEHDAPPIYGQPPPIFFLELRNPTLAVGIQYLRIEQRSELFNDGNIGNQRSTLDRNYLRIEQTLDKH
jgi:hypothetical protein